MNIAVFKDVTPYKPVHDCPRPEKKSGVSIFIIVLKTEIIVISVFNQLDAQNLFHNKFYFMPLHVSSTCARNM